MNGVGQQNRHQGAQCGQLPVYITPNFQNTHVNEPYGQAGHSRPNGRPTYILPQGATAGSGQRFVPPQAMVRNGVSFSGTPHPMPQVLNHPVAQGTPSQGDLPMAAMYQGMPTQDNAQMEFSPAPVMYQNVNQQAQIFQQQPEGGMYMRQPFVTMFRYPQPQYVPSQQLFLQTRPAPMAVHGNPPPNHMQTYQAQVAMNHQVLQQQQQQQQQQQTPDMRQDASTPQSHPIPQFIQSIGFPAESPSFYYSHHPPLAQPPPMMHGQQPMQFNSYLPHGPAPVDQTPMQVTPSQRPVKQGTHKAYIMYQNDYLNLASTSAMTGGSNTLSKKEKRAIKIIDPNTNKEIDMVASSKPDVSETFQKQVKEVAQQQQGFQTQAHLLSCPDDVLPQQEEEEPSRDVTELSGDVLEGSAAVPLSSVYETAHETISDTTQMTPIESTQTDVAMPHFQNVVLTGSISSVFRDGSVFPDNSSNFVLEMSTNHPSSVDASVTECPPSAIKEEVMEEEKEVPPPTQDIFSQIEPRNAHDDNLHDEEEDEVQEEEEDEDDNENKEDTELGRKQAKKAEKTNQDKEGSAEIICEEPAEEIDDGDRSMARLVIAPNQREELNEPDVPREEENVECELSLVTPPPRNEEEIREEDLKEDSVNENEVIKSNESEEISDIIRKVDDCVLKVEVGQETDNKFMIPVMDLKNAMLMNSAADCIDQIEEIPSPLSPANGLTKGRRVYSREFLINLRDCPEAMKKLPTISSDLTDILRPMPYFKREPSVGAMTTSMGMGIRGVGGQQHQTMIGSFNDFSMFNRSSSQQQNRASKKPSQKRDFPQQSQQRVINVTLNSDVQLHTSDQAWKPSVKSLVPIVASGEEDVTQKLYKTTRSILNKLTPQNFDTLLKQVKELQIDNEGKLSGCMDLVFEKAISEPSFCVAYAKMAHNISTMKVPSKEDSTEFVSFRKLLLNRCQTEFEKDKIEEIELERRQKEIDECDAEDKKKLLILEKEDVTRKARRRSLGNIRFIGELFKMKMLTEKIMFDCLTRLMKTDDEDSIECLCWLVRTIGKDLDQPRNKKALDPLFTEISKKSESKNVSLRTKFMLQDINELRANNWVPRRVDVNPRTIEQIHKEAQQEEQQKQAFISQSPLLPNNFSHYSQQMHNMPKNIMDSASRLGSSGVNRFHGNQRGHQVSEEGWTTFTSKGGGRGPAVIIDHAKLRLSKQNVDEMPIKLGPCRPQWSQGAGSGGSSGVGTGSQFQSGSRHSSQESEKSSTSSSNRYAVMSSLGENHDFQRTNRTPAFKDPASAARHQQYYRIQAEVGYGSLPLSSRSKNTDQSSRPNSGSCNASRDSSLSREASNRASPVMYSSMPSKQQMPVIDMQSSAMQQSSVDKDLMLDELVFKRKTKYLVDEYISIKDDKEALLSAQELHMLGSSKTLQLFVYTIVNHVIEKSTNDIQMTGNLLYLLHKNSIIDTKSLTGGLEEGLRDAPDLEIDIPRIWDRYSDLLGSMLIQSFDLFQLISDAIQCLRSGIHAAPLVARCMLRVAKHHGVQQAVSLWNARRISWSHFTNENLHDFTIVNKLESLLPISSELLILMNSDADNDAIFSWINDHVRPHEHEAMFIRSLVTAACNASLRVHEDVYELEEVVFRKYCSLLNKYIDHNADRELQSLFAIQSLVHSLEHPPNVLNSFFHMLYDVELISEDAFWEWEKCDDPLEQNGKGVATASTKPFFQWLRESIEEEDTS